MAHIAEERQHKEVTRDKYKIIAKARSMKHDELQDHVQSHMLGCTDPDCDICDMGESGSMIDDDDEGEPTGKNTHNIGKRSSKGREGAGFKIDSVGKASSKLLKSRH